jgi:cation diffusion facilitator family transporter
MLVAGAATGSPALLATGIHSFVDTADQLISFRAQHRARPSAGGQRAADDYQGAHHWSLIHSMLVLGAGAGACLALGLARLSGVGDGAGGSRWGYAVLGISAVVEGASWLVGARKVERARGATSRWRFLRESTDPALVAVVAQDSAALLGVLLAIAGVLGSRLLGLPWLDPIAAMCIGLTLASAALVLARERSVLAGSGGAGSASIERLRTAIAREPGVAAVGGIWTLHLGPDELLVGCEIQFRGDLIGDSAEEAIDRVERAARAAEPRASRVLVGVEPSRWRATSAGERRPGGTGTRLG